MGFGSNKGFTPGEEGLQVAEADGAPDVTGVKKIVVSNGTLTDDGDGQVTLTTGGGGGGGGDVDGPASSTDNAVARFDLATGKLLQNSTLLVSDTAQIGVAGDLDLIAPASGTVTFNIGDVAGSDFKVINAGSTSVLHAEGDTGHVGIGVDAPAVPLHVSTDLDFVAKFESTDAASAIVIQDNASTNNGNRVQVTGDEMRLFTANSERVRIDNAGFVGIGAINPLSKLHISGTTLKQVLTLENNGGRVDLGLAGGGSDILAGSAKGDLVISNETGNDILFGTSNAQRMMIDKAGNVGIGPNVDPPAAALSVSGSTLELRDDGTVNSNPGISVKNDAREYKLQTRGAQSDLFAIRDSNAGANRLSLLTTGLIGLGVDDPDAALEIFNTSAQLKLSYDASNHVTNTVADDGELLVTTVGTAADITLDPGSQIINFGAGDAAAATHIHLAAGDGIIEERYKLGAASHFIIVVDETPDKTKFAVGDGKQIVLTTITNRLKNHDHATPADPTLFVHSNTDPDTNNTQWVSLAHNQTDAILEVGKGSLIVSGAIADVGVNQGQLRIAYDGSNYTDFHVDETGDFWVTSSGGDSTFSAASSMQLRRNGNVFLEIDAGNHLNSNRRFHLASDGAAGNGQFSIGSLSNPDTMILKGGTAAVGVGGVVEPVAALHVSASHGAHNGGPVFQADSIGSGLIFSVTGSTTLGAGKVIITGSMETQGVVTQLPGGGFDGGAAVPIIRTQKINHEIITTIIVDLAGYTFDNGAGTVIGDNGVASAHILKLTNAVNGVIYKAEMGCIEDSDTGAGQGRVLLVTNPVDLTQGADATSAGITWIDPGTDWLAGMWDQSAVRTDNGAAEEDFVYLAVGVAPGGSFAYSTGKLVIKLYGANF